MDNAGQKNVVGAICCPYRAWLVGDMPATKMPLLTELGGTNDIRLLYENPVRFLN